MNSQGATVFEPSVEWVNEDDCDTLLLYLPGFVKEQLRVQLKSRTLIISGQRKLQDNTWTRFEKEFQVAEHCDSKNISAKFEGSILYIRQPKLITPVAKQDEKSPINAPNATSEYPKDEPKVNKEQAKIKPDSLAQTNGINGEGKNVKDVPKKDSVEKDEPSKGKVGELKDAEGICENGSKRMITGGSGIVRKLKLSRNDLIKVLALIVGFVVGVYCTKSFQSWIA